MRLGTVAAVLRPNGLAIWIMHAADGSHGPQIIPNVEHEHGDYAELVDKDCNPIVLVKEDEAEEEDKPYNPDTKAWWVRCCHADGTFIWLMPFEVWRVFRDRAAEAAMSEHP
jgi:hypothetical protein